MEYSFNYLIRLSTSTFISQVYFDQEPLFNMEDFLFKQLNKISPFIEFDFFNFTFIKEILVFKMVNRFPPLMLF